MSAVAPLLQGSASMFNVGLTQLLINGWSQLVRAYFFWNELTFGEDMCQHVLLTIFQPWVLSEDKSKGWYYLIPWRAHAPYVVGLPSSIKGWKKSYLWIKERWQMVEGDTTPACTIPTQYSEAHECL